MKNLMVLLLIYTTMLAFSQILLKSGATQLGGFTIRGLQDILPLIFQMIKNPFIIVGSLLLATSYFLWIYMLSWFKLGMIFPLSAIAFIFVAIMSYFILGERFSPLNYFGMLMIFSGLFFLLYK
ncbi:MAG: hypothetical protein ABIE84_02500 [bacterium]